MPAWFCPQNKKAADHVTDGAEQIKMVAGTRDQHCLHLDEVWL